MTTEATSSLVRSPGGADAEAGEVGVAVQSDALKRVKQLKYAVGVLSAVALVFLIVIIALAVRKDSSSSAAPAADPTQVTITILHVNDVYEVSGVSDGDQGAIARVATLKQQLKAQNPNTFMVLSGDLLSPSALSTASYGGRALAGRQMVEAFNAAGLDYATFGNHEFDLSYADFASRLSESQFVWTSANVFNATGRSVTPGSESYPLFDNCPRFVEFTLNGKAQGAADDSNAIRVGLFGVSINSNIKPWNWVTNTSRAVQIGVETARLLRARGNDLVIAVTHQDIAIDIQLAQATEDIDIITAGHEHANFIEESGPTRNGFERFIPIAVADANARSAWIHTLEFSTRTRKLTGPIASVLQPVNYVTFPSPDPTTQAIADKWTARAFAYFEQSGFAPMQTAGYITEPLDGLEANIRSTQTGLTRLVAGSMYNASWGVGFRPALSLVNSGSMRLDDVIPIGNITQYDCLRVLPFANGIVTVGINGALLLQVLNYGWTQTGHGAYLGWANVGVNADDGTPTWTVAGAPLNSSAAYTYVAAVSDYLLQGIDIPMLTRAVVTVLSNGTPAQEPDTRAAFIAQVGRVYPYPPPGGFAPISAAAAADPGAQKRVMREQRADALDQFGLLAHNRKRAKRHAALAAEALKQLERPERSEPDTQ